MGFKILNFSPGEGGGGGGGVEGWFQKSDYLFWFGDFCGDSLGSFLNSTGFGSFLKSTVFQSLDESFSIANKISNNRT